MNKISDPKSATANSEDKHLNVAFGTTQERPILPVKLPNNSLGPKFYYKSRFPPGPGYYETAEITSALYEQNRRAAMNKKGWGFGMNKTPRLAKQILTLAPPCTKYQPDKSALIEFEENPAPFNSDTIRFCPEKVTTAFTPGPGFYDHRIETNRRVKVQGSFGGTQTAVQPVIIKCVIENRDRCYNCGNAPVGDYYQYKNESLCRPCHHKLAHTETTVVDTHLQLFQKVRDCSFMHDHQGTPTAIKLVNDKELKKLQRREAFLNLYF